LLVFHTIALMPAMYWTGITGVLMAILLFTGSVSALLSLGRCVGRSRRHGGHIVSLARHGNVLEVVCELDDRWPGHRPGQFAYLTFDPAEGAHPFTIACAPQQGSRRISFQIKALGDYTSKLGERLHIGQPLLLEGPYGRLDYRTGRHYAAQVWVAGGIGITPFLAWLEAARVEPLDVPVQMHYCVRNAKKDPLIERVRNLCKELPSVTLHVHDQSASQCLDAEGVLSRCRPSGGLMDVWFCGPAPFAKALEKGLRAVLGRGVRMHREIFDMR